MSPAQILIVEDDKNLRLTLADNLAEAGHAVALASTVAEARLRLSEQRFELIVLDVMLPDGDGYSLCRELRASGVSTPVLMLTARTLEDDLVRGFEAGAQDYLGKPYRLRELHARIGALLRRAERPPEAEILFGGFRLDPRRRLVHAPDGSPVELTRKEFDLLAYLLANRDRALTRDALLDAVWGKDVVVDAHTVDNFVSSLRKKLARPGAAGFAIHTLRGAGSGWWSICLRRAEISAPWTTGCLKASGWTVAGNQATRLG